MSEQRIMAPHDREAEQAVLGAVIHSGGKALDIIKGYLEPEHFYSPGNQRIFEAMQKMRDRGDPIDELLLKAEFTDVGLVGGMAYIAEMVDKTPVASNVAVYAEIVKKAWKARATIEAAQDLIYSVTKSGALNGENEILRQRLEAIGGADTPTRSDSAQKAMEDFQAWFRTPEGDKAAEIKTYTALDKHLEIAPGKPTVVAARPGVGKTTFAAQTLIRNALHGVPSLFFNLEMSNREIIGRAIAAFSGVTGTKLLYRRLDSIYQEEWGAIDGAIAQLKGLPFWLHEPRLPVTVAQIENVARWYQQNRGVRLVVIDHLRKIRTAPGPIYEQQTRRICDLAAMAKSLNLAVLVTAQINREGDERPGLKYLEGSGAIEQESQAVVILHDPEPNSDTHRKIEGVIAKNRNGQKGKIELDYFPWKYVIE